MMGKINRQRLCFATLGLLAQLFALSTDADEPLTADPAVTAAEAQAELETELAAAQERFLDYFADELYNRARASAEQTLRLARELHGESSMETALALTNLATAQSRLGKQEQALNNYNASIAIIEDLRGRVAPALVNPMLGLAATENALGAYNRGLKTYQRALRINHVNQGLNNLEQMKIRDGLTESYTGLGEIEKASFQQEVQLRIYTEEFPGDVDRLVPALYKLAEWYGRSNQPEEQMYLLQRAVTSIRKDSGKNSVEQIEALRRVAATYQQLNMPNESIRTIKKALRLNDESPDRDPALSADIRIELGDFYNGFGSLRDARRSYTEAWRILDTEVDDPDLLQQYFGQPVNLWQIELPPVFPAKSKTREQFVEQPELFAEGYLLASFVVDENGRVDDITIIEADPAEMLEKRVKYLLDRYKYRPRFVDGVPVSTDNLFIRHRFNYLVNKANTPPEDKSAPANSGRINYPGEDD